MDLPRGVPFVVGSCPSVYLGGAVNPVPGLGCNLIAVGVQVVGLCGFVRSYEDVEFGVVSSARARDPAIGIPTAGVVSVVSEEPVPVRGDDAFPIAARVAGNGEYGVSLGAKGALEVGGCEGAVVAVLHDLIAVGTFHKVRTIAPSLAHVVSFTRCVGPGIDLFWVVGIDLDVGDFVSVQPEQHAAVRVVAKTGKLEGKCRDAFEVAVFAVCGLGAASGDFYGHRAWINRRGDLEAVVGSRTIEVAHGAARYVQV